ncbi:TetR/AcrR family transcriptional regulator [Flavobacteriaceae bacterium TK19130]|nr:TetR/AcrR family transcriptional regulator [Thermobacterium salinum]
MKISTRKEEIIAVASHLFKEKGYTAVTMRDIAYAMDMKAASLYNHISGKQELLHSLVMRVAHAFTDGMEEVRNSSISPLSKITRIIEIHIDITVAHPDALATMNNDWMHLEEEALQQFVAMRDAYEENFRTILKEGMNKGELKNRHPEVMLFSILSTLRTLYLWYQKRGKVDENVLKRDMTEVLLKGIVKR